MMCGCEVTRQLSTIFHTAFLLQRRHSFLSPIMASSSDPFRTPQSTTPAFESGYIGVSEQFVYIRCISSHLFNLPDVVPPFFPSFFRLYIFYPSQRRSMFVAIPCESVGFVGYRSTYADTQRSRRVFPGCIYHSRLGFFSESRIP